MKTSVGYIRVYIIFGKAVCSLFSNTFSAQRLLRNGVEKVRLKRRLASRSVRVGFIYKLRFSSPFEFGSGYASLLLTKCSIAKRFIFISKPVLNSVYFIRFRMFGSLKYVIALNSHDVYINHTCIFRKYAVFFYHRKYLCGIARTSHKYFVPSKQHLYSAKCK